MAIRTKKSRKGARRRAGQSRQTDPVGLVEGERGRSVLQLRAQLGLSREKFSRLADISVRTLAALEAGSPASEKTRRTLTEIHRLAEALKQLVRPEAIGPWLETPCEAFDGLRPLEVIERGHVDRIWQMIFSLREGGVS